MFLLLVPVPKQFAIDDLAKPVTEPTQFRLVFETWHSFRKSNHYILSHIGRVRFLQLAKAAKAENHGALDLNKLVPSRLIAPGTNAQKQTGPCTSFSVDVIHMY